MTVTQLTWAVKESLLAYIGDLEDGELVGSDGATFTGEHFSFEVVDATSGEGSGFDNAMLTGMLCFRGTATLRGHDGMLNVVLTDPCIVLDNGEGEIRVAYPGAKDGRQLDIAKLTASREGDDIVADAYLTMTGVNVLGPQYLPGTKIAPVRIHAS
jgi:hypothetical protein